MDDRIVLDRKSFEALAVDTRVKILKSLKQRRKTLTELAKEQNMSVSGIKEHLEVLEKTGLIEKIDDGHKWKYYELTKKGNEIIGPREVKVMILLSISIVSLIASLFVMMVPAQMAATETLQNAGASEEEFAADKIMVTAEAVPEAAGDFYKTESEEDMESVPDRLARANISRATDEEPSPVPGAVALISAITIIASIAVMAKNRMR
ncbi:winged helix-turn-helix transcriptional regulator [Candidatus Micrarchaeota archaeon]|nr:winged helix-turn-helix transcriptional regulator [Candidatus Micrarchaeota archaeon]